MSDLDQFRREWQREVAQRQGSGRPENSGEVTHSGEKVRNVRIQKHSGKGADILESSQNDEPELKYLSEDPTFKPETLTRPEENVFINTDLSDNDVSALKSFEQAVDREHVGKMADAVKHYRDAFKKNEQVDKLYREKYFSNVKPSAQASSSGSTLKKSGYHEEPKSADALAEEALMRRMQKLHLENNKAEEEGTDEAGIIPEGPLIHLPPEVTALVLQTVALNDLSDFTKMTFSCSKLSYIGYTTQGIWKALCYKEFGCQHYSPNYIEEYDGNVDEEVIANNIYNHSWRRMYLERPRLWFNGVYISTCNYLRPGMGESWNAPIHMVTYYRYLRFYEDGTCISLLTTNEPSEIVPNFNQRYVNDNINGNIVYARDDGTVLGHQKGVVNGTWKLDSRDGQILIETEGSVDRYIFYMRLQIRSSGHNKLNKLKWINFWSFNKLTQDYGEFSLKHDKAYFFVRTRH